MPKTRDAFAFRDFDPERIWKRKFLTPFFFATDDKDNGFVKNFIFFITKQQFTDLSTDEKILNAYYGQALALDKQESRLRQILYRMNKIVEKINDYEEKIIHHYNRLEKYSKVWNKMICEDENLSAEEIRTKGRRLQKLLKSYYNVMGIISTVRGFAVKYILPIEALIRKDDRKIFADRLRQARKETNLTQAQLAEKIGMTQGGYTNYENSIREPSIATLKKLARILNKSTDWLLGLTP